MLFQCLTHTLLMCSVQPDVASMKNKRPDAVFTSRGTFGGTASDSLTSVLFSSSTTEHVSISEVKVKPKALSMLPLLIAVA